MQCASCIYVRVSLDPRDTFLLYMCQLKACIGLWYATIGLSTQSYDAMSPAIYVVTAMYVI